MKTENVKNDQGYESYDSLSVCGNDRKSSLSDHEFDRKSSLSDAEFDPISDDEENDYKTANVDETVIDGLTEQITGIQLVARAPMKHIDNYKETLRNDAKPWSVQTQNTVTPSGGRVINFNNIGRTQNLLTTNFNGQNVFTTNLQNQNVLTANLPSQNILTTNLQSQNVLRTNIQSQNNNNSTPNNNNFFSNNLNSIKNNNGPLDNVYHTTSASSWTDPLTLELEQQLQQELQRLDQSTQQQVNNIALHDESSRDTEFSGNEFVQNICQNIPSGKGHLPVLSLNDLDEILGSGFFDLDDDEALHQTSSVIEDGDKNDYASPLSVGLTIVPPSVASSSSSSPSNMDYLFPSVIGSPNAQCLTSSALSPNIFTTLPAATVSPNITNSFTSNLDFLAASPNISTRSDTQQTDLPTNLLRTAATTTAAAATANMSPPNFPVRSTHYHQSTTASVISSSSSTFPDYLSSNSFHEVRQSGTSISSNSTPSHPGSSEYSPISESHQSPYSSTPDLYHRFSPNIIDTHDTIIPVTVNEDTGEDDDNTSSSRKSSNTDNVSAKDRLQQKFHADPVLRQRKKNAYLKANLKAPEEILPFIQSLFASDDNHLEVELYTNIEVFVYNATRDQIEQLFRTVRFMSLSSIKNNPLLSAYIREVMLDHDIDDLNHRPVLNAAW